MPAAPPDNRFRRYPRVLVAMLPLIVLTGALWYLAGARDLGRLAAGLVAFAVLLVAVMHLPNNWRHRLGLMIIGASVGVGAALTPTHHDDGMLAIILVGLLLALVSRVAPDRLPGRRLLERGYAAIGGAPAEPPVDPGR